MANLDCKSDKNDVATESDEKSRRLEDWELAFGIYLSRLSTKSCPLRGAAPGLKIKFSSVAKDRVHNGKVDIKGILNAMIREYTESHPMFAIPLGDFLRLVERNPDRISFDLCFTRAFGADLNAVIFLDLLYDRLMLDVGGPQPNPLAVLNEFLPMIPGPAKALKEKGQDKRELANQLSDAVRREYERNQPVAQTAGVRAKLARARCSVFTRVDTILGEAEAAVARNKSSTLADYNKRRAAILKGISPVGNAGSNR